MMDFGRHLSDLVKHLESDDNVQQAQIYLSELLVAADKHVDGVESRSKPGGRRNYAFGQGSQQTARVESVRTILLDIDVPLRLGDSHAIRLAKMALAAWQSDQKPKPEGY